MEIAMNIIQVQNKRFIAVKTFFVAILLSAACFVDARVRVANPTGFTYREPLFIDSNKTPLLSFNHVAFVQDSNKITFVIKCYADAEHAIHEALGAYVGASLGMRINKVKIIPPHMRCVGKDDDCVATIHTCVPGKEVEYIDNMNSRIDIKGGLTCSQHLQCLVEHDELCSIVALDIFLDNFDRHNGNLFFDAQTNHFYAIDMDRILWSALHFPNMIQPLEDGWDIKEVSNLATNAYNYLITLSSEQLSPQEMRALDHVRDWLNKLLDKYPSLTLFDLWMSLAQEATYVYIPVKKQYIKNLVDYNYCQVQSVIAQLDTLVVA
jgi:hypothetical protein